MIDYDAELHRHQQAFRLALNICPDDRVLDIGCGAGQTTREAALAAHDGFAVGIDIARPLLRGAQRLTKESGGGNVAYVRGDAAQHPFLPASFDLAISRFGTMFFAQPESAFRNIRGALRPGARLVMMVWQAASLNEWAVAIHRALVNDERALPPTTQEPSAFSLGDEHTVRHLLHASDFVDVAFHDVHESVYYGRDVESAVAFVSQFSNVASVMTSKGPAERERLLARLGEVMEGHYQRDSVWFDSRAWIVTARCG